MILRKHLKVLTFGNYSVSRLPKGKWTQWGDVRIQSTRKESHYWSWWSERIDRQYLTGIMNWDNGHLEV